MGAGDNDSLKTPVSCAGNGYYDLGFTPSADWRKRFLPLDRYQAGESLV